MNQSVEAPSPDIEVCEYSIEFPKCLRPSHRAAQMAMLQAAPRVPRLARLMALAIRFDRLISEGVVQDYADIARLGYVTRARLTQIMSLLFLAPDIQEQILHLPTVRDQGPDPVTECEIRSISALADWKRQRRLWKALVGPARTNRHRT